MMSDSKKNQDGNSAFLEARNVGVNYGGIQALVDVNLTVNRGEVVSILGANGAGKSSLLRAMCGLVKLKSGEIYYDGMRTDKMRTSKITKAGLFMQSEGHPTFAAMSVRDNLKVAFNALSKEEADQGPAEMEKVIDLFPVLGNRLDQHAGTLSGGEQQMLSIARGLISKPKIILLDEPSLGLAPLIIQHIFEIIDKIKTMGVTIVIVEQNVKIALYHSDRGYVFEKGHIVIEGKSEDLLQNDEVRKVYLGEM
jgi:branched-chain amino acid transport system ATP-binding protein